MKYIKKGIFLIGVLVCIYAYSIVDNTELLYNASTSTNAYQGTGIIYNTILKQTFIPNENALDAIILKSGLNGDCSNVKVLYSIIDENGRTVAKAEKDAVDIKDLKLCKYPFEKIEGCKGKQYTLLIKESGATEEQGVSFYIDSTIRNSTVLLNDEVIGGTLVAKLVTHRFDIKTFIIVSVFIIYLYFFALFLTYMFK